MRAGKLSEKITIERSGSTVNEFGTVTEGWTPVATVRAQIVQQSTEEFLRSSGEASDTAIVFRVRHMDGVTNGDRIVFKGQPFDLKEIKELGRRQGLDLRCVAAGV